MPIMVSGHRDRLNAAAKLENFRDRTMSYSGRSFKISNIESSQKYERADVSLSVSRFEPNS